MNKKNFCLILSLVITDANALTNKEFFDIGREAYIYGYPLVLMGITRNLMLNRAPINKFFHMRRFPTDKFRDIVRPNVDTLYSSAWLDLSKSPIILSVPDTHDRYYLLEILDAWTNVFASIGKRTTGTKAKKFIIVGPGWSGKIPKKFIKIQAPTNIVWILGRTQTNGKKDYKFVHAIQDGFKLKALTHTNVIANIKSRIEHLTFPTKKLIPPAQQIANMNAKTFFEYFAKELKINCPADRDKPIVDKLKTIGIGRPACEVGKDFDISNLPKETIAILDKAIMAAKKELLQKSKSLGKSVNGWRILQDIGTYGTDYKKRAIVAYIGIGANLPKDAIYPTAFVDSDGDQLNGKNKYILHFAADSLPPVNAFWSVTMYNSKSYLVSNPIDCGARPCYALGDRDDLQFNDDGSLDIYIQKNKPAKQIISNWLPAPADDFNLTLRLYWPKEQVLNGAWNPPGIKKNKFKNTNQNSSI